MENKVLLLSHPSMDFLASEVVQKCEDKAQLVEGKSQKHMEFLKRIKWDHFPDEFPNIFIQDVRDMAGKDVIFLASFHHPATIFEQLSLIYAIPRYLARSFTLILPYFPTGTMERVDTEGQIATAKTLATLLSAIPLTARGPTQIVIFDIHALQERFYFDNAVIPRLESAIPLLLHKLSELPSDPKVSVAFPDEGAYKRFHRFFPGMDTIICSKTRNGEKRSVRVREGNPASCHVVIVDDLVMTGGTLKECAKVLLQSGASCVSAYVTHAVFPHESWRGFTWQESKLFTKFWLTDSVPHARSISAHAPFELLSLADAIATMLLGYDLKKRD